MLPAGNGMKSVRFPVVKAPTKVPTGITGFDEITGGGLPSGRTTLWVGTVRTIAADQSPLEPAATRAVAETMKGFAGSDPNERAAKSLSSQEKRVLALVADGKTNKEIAAALGLSDKTVKNYLSNIFKKLQVGRRARAAVIYRQSNPD
jgi:DNA-binding NarL/FixJ family response regulator